ncbi:hypothetical protein COO16_04220 [Bacillus pseudomycoides]|uniref:hypothetical protein n=1 Tax=Bacillus pseudomycoides TaxID=64104 RepID=UPI000BED9817|nr:hypothetical protein [Bacillus pseudomycoides]PDY14174.1 hypothetical protein COO16_04220 [Bacillus pseudomycoides]
MESLKEIVYDKKADVLYKVENYRLRKHHKKCESDVMGTIFEGDIELLCFADSYGFNLTVDHERIPSKFRQVSSANYSEHFPNKIIDTGTKEAVLQFAVDYMEFIVKQAV